MSIEIFSDNGDADESFGREQSFDSEDSEKVMWEICPYCGTELDEESASMSPEGDTYELILDCPECYKKYGVLYKVCAVGILN